MDISDHKGNPKSFSSDSLVPRKAKQMLIFAEFSLRNKGTEFQNLERGNISRVSCKSGKQTSACTRLFIRITSLDIF